MGIPVSVGCIEGSHIGPNIDDVYRNLFEMAHILHMFLNGRGLPFSRQTYGAECPTVSNIPLSKCDVRVVAGQLGSMSTPINYSFPHS